MLIIFIASFLLAVIFSTILFLTFPADFKNKSFRPMFLLLFALIGWFVTLPALIAPNQNITTYATYNVTTPQGTIIFQAHNSTSAANNPFPISTFWTYIPFYSAMIMIHFLILLLWLINYFKQQVEVAMDAA